MDMEVPVDEYCGDKFDVVTWTCDRISIKKVVFYCITDCYICYAFFCQSDYEYFLNFDKKYYILRFKIAKYIEYKIKIGYNITIGGDFDD